MLNFDRFTVKHNTQNIQNDCHHQLSDSIRVRSSLVYSAPPDLLAGLRGTTSEWKGEGREKGIGGYLVRGLGGRGRRVSAENFFLPSPPKCESWGDCGGLTVFVNFNI